MKCRMESSATFQSTLPTRERGLKPSWSYVAMPDGAVAPHAGAWIETTMIGGGVAR